MSSSSGVLVLLLLLFSLLLSGGMGLIILLLRRAGRQPASLITNGAFLSSPGFFMLWPGCWLAIKGHHSSTVQLALQLRNPKPSSWLEALAGEREIFIAAPIKGWVIVSGNGLPDPGEDVDACFRFVLDLSRKLGEVQFFSASPLMGHHAWIRVENGRVLRAYAWAGTTVWNQGSETAAEKKLGLKCYDYAQTEPTNDCARTEQTGVNVEKVPLLAAQWGFDPGWIQEHFLRKRSGITGELSATGAASGRSRHA